MALEQIPPKRKKLYEFIFKIISLKEADEGELEINIDNLKEFKVLVEKLHSVFKTIPGKLVDKLIEIDNENKIFEKIQNKEFLKELKSNTSELSNEIKEKILGLITRGLKESLEEEKSLEGPSDKQVIQFLSDINGKLDSLTTKIDAKIEEKNQLIDKNDKNLEQILKLNKEIERSNSFSEVQSSIQDLNRIHPKPTTYIFSMLKKSLKNNLIDETRIDTIFNTQLKQNLIETIILFILSNYGNMSLITLIEKATLDGDKLFTGILSLIEKGLIIQAGEENHNPLYSSEVLGNPLLKYLEKHKDKLFSLKSKFSSTLSDELNKTMEKFDEKINDSKKLLKIKITDYDSDLNPIETSLNQLEGLLPKEEVLTKEMKFRIESMIEAYNMYRLPLVIEKDENIEIEDDNKIPEAFKILLDQDFLKGKIIRAIKKLGPLDINQLENETGISKTKLFIILNILRMDDDIIAKDIGKEFEIFDIPRKVSVQQKFLRTFFTNLLKFIDLSKNLKEKTVKLKENLFEVNEIAISAKGALLEIQNLQYHKQELLKDVPIEVIKEINQLTDKFLDLRSKVKVGKKELDFSKLVPIKITKVDENYTSYIEGDEIIGFGTIESDEIKCISCGKCERVCPENAAILEKTWNLPILFEMKDEEIESLPENRKEIIQLIKKMAKKKPSSITVPTEILGFGKSTFDPVKCIACKECLDQCPNESISFEEIWNVPEIIKKLSVQKII